MDGSALPPASPLSDVYVKEPSPEGEGHQDEVMTPAGLDSVGIMY